MGVKHHRKIYNLCNGLYQQKPQDTDTCCRSNSIRTRLHLPPPLSPPYSPPKKKEAQWPRFRCWEWPKKPSNETQKLTLRSSRFPFFSFLAFLIFFSHLFIEFTAHNSSSFYHYYFRFLFVRDVEEENEDLKKTTKNKTTPLSRSTVPDIDL